MLWFWFGWLSAGFRLGFGWIVVRFGLDFASSLASTRISVGFGFDLGLILVGFWPIII